MADMTIGRLAEIAGVGVETVRFYERKGLIDCPRRPQRGFRIYPDSAVGRIRFIRQAQDLGFTLREIDELLSLRADPATDCAKVWKQATIKLADVGDKIARLQRIKGALEELIAACPRRGALRACSIMEALGQPPKISAPPRPQRRRRPR
ncbi:MAG: MerR family transcriptional regulator [Rhodospirillales bacterium]|nr:MerR family transcriptional regulator [Rhodospirillales bacterium]